MGRKGQGHTPKHSFKSKNRQNLTKEDRDLRENIDKLLRISTIPQQPNVLKALQNHVEISAITDTVKSLEIHKDARISVGNRATATIIENFTRWALENGAEFKGCSIEEFQDYDLGLKVNTDIPQSSLIIAVPRKLMMSIETARKSELKYLIENDQILKNMHNVTLSIFLLLEKFKENSFWEPYINILPKSYSTVLYFTTEELEELKGSPTLETALRQIKSIARQYAYFHKLFSTSNDAVSLLMREKFTYKEYCWAVSTVMTRQNTIPSQDGGSMINALIPLWDMCNHMNGTISTDYNPQLDRSECLALKDFKPGEQFFIFYGARTNADLFIHNGFVYEENVHDGYWIRLGISKSDPLEEKRKELLKVLSISPASEFFIRKGREPVDGELLAFLRVFNMNEEQLQHWLDSDKSADLQYAACSLDPGLESKSWSFLLARLRLLLGIYKTTLEEDLAMLEGSSLTGNKRLAVRMRATEKRILRDTADHVEQLMKQ